MSVIGSNIIAGASGTVETGYQIARSLRFNSADSAYLNRTPGTAGNRKTWTMSFWIKRTKITDDYQRIFSARGATGELTEIVWNNETSLKDNLVIENYTSSVQSRLVTTPVYRDVSAWYHVLIAYDTTQATSTNRVRVYINNVEVTSFASGSYPAQNVDTYVNSTFVQKIGTGTDFAVYLNAYLADFYLIDGQALTPSSFGQTDSATGVWVPKAYTGTYGTNGFWLKFDDNSGTTSTTLGKDSSGNSNNWTPNNFSVTAGAGNDSLVDSPTNYGTDTGAGGEVRGNYCTLNPLLAVAGQTSSFSNGNLEVSSSTTTNSFGIGTIEVSSGKWYFEGTPSSSSGNATFGVWKITSATTTFYINPNENYRYFGSDGKIYNGTSSGGGVSQNYSTFTDGDIIGVALDLDNGKVYFSKNGVWQGSSNPATQTNPAASGLTGSWAFGANAGDASGRRVICNFGQRPFAYTAPSGFKALCTQNLPTPTIGTSSTNLADDYFNVVTYTGTGSSLSITGVGFQPDLVWIKGRSGTTDHALYDAVRGVQKQLESNTTTDETTETTGLTAFGTDGFTVGALAQLNTSAATYVGWNWKESATSGFDIVTYTGNGANRTIAHNLGVAPKMLIVKARTTASTDTGWPVWHTGIANTNYLELHATTASTSGTTYWNSTSPTSSVFSVGTAAAVNTNNDTYVAYLFAEVTGFSKIETYTGNGNADGPFVYCGFRPKFVMTKNASSSVQGWTLQNPANQNYNEINNYVFAQSSNAETGTYGKIDFLSNGFKIRTSDTLVNGNTHNIIFIAFAENPFNYSRAR